MDYALVQGHILYGNHLTDRKAAYRELFPGNHAVKTVKIGPLAAGPGPSVQHLGQEPGVRALGVAASHKIPLRGQDHYGPVVRNHIQRVPEQLGGYGQENPGIPAGSPGGIAQGTDQGKDVWLRGHPQGKWVGLQGEEIFIHGFVQMILKPRRLDDALHIVRASVGGSRLEQGTSLAVYGKLVNVLAVAGNGAEIPQYIGCVDPGFLVRLLGGGMEGSREEQGFAFRTVLHNINHLLAGNAQARGQGAQPAGCIGCFIMYHIPFVGCIIV